MDEIKCQQEFLKLNKMNLHDMIELSPPDKEAAVMVMRVPGGWIYTFDFDKSDGHVALSSVFVPYSELITN